MYIKIITIVTQKGDAGKTTITTNLSVQVLCVKDNQVNRLPIPGSKLSLEYFLKRGNKKNPIVIEAGSQKILFRILDLVIPNMVKRLEYTDV